jgi:MFS superfamily sulfate permease-like transporter
VVSVIDVRSLRTFARVRRSELYIAVGCTAAVLVLGPTGGLVLAMLATMVDMVRRVAASPWVTLEPPEGDWEMERFAAVAEPDATPAELEGVVFVRLTGPLFFANADPLRERIEAAATADVEWVLLDFESVTDVDPTASEALADSIAAVRELGKVVGIARVAAPVRAMLDTYGISADLGEDRFFTSNRAALSSFLDRPDAPSAP